MNQELSRLLTLFDQLVMYNEAWLDKMPADKMEWVPLENESMRFGNRVSRITVKGLMIHMAVGERAWVEQIARCESGDVIPIPSNPELAEKLGQGDWRGNLLALHRENLEVIRAFGEAELEKTLMFADRRWTGMGLLWAMYSHRAFHLGNINIYLRQTNTIAPDYFRFPSEIQA